MVYSNLSKAVKDIKILQDSMRAKHQEIIKILDSTDLEGLPVTLTQDFPNKIWLDIYSFEKLANLSNDLYDLDLQKSEKIDRFGEGIKDLSKLKKMTQSFKVQLESITARLTKDSKFIEKVIKKVSLVIGEFRERCLNNIKDFLKNLDLDLRRVLKPLVPSNVVDENVQFPRLNSSDLIDSIRSIVGKSEDDEDLNENEKLTNHINMLVETLEKVAKELLQVLYESNRKYYEVVHPEQLFSEAPTPLAMPLPEYFTFENIDNPYAGLVKEPFHPSSIESLKLKVEKLLRRGSLTTCEAKNMLDKIDKMILQNSNDLEQVLKDMPNDKKEDIVFQIIHSSMRGDSPKTLRKEINKKQQKSPKNLGRKSITPLGKDKQIFKPRNSVPNIAKQRRSSLPKTISTNKIKNSEENKTRTPTRIGIKKKSKKLQGKNNKSFLV